MAQANRNNACECHLQAAQAETQVLGSATRQPKHQSGKVKQSQGDLGVTNELKYACRPQGEQTGKTLHKIFPDKAGPGPPAKSPNLRGGGSPLFTLHTSPASNHRGVGQGPFQRITADTHTMWTHIPQQAGQRHYNCRPKYCKRPQHLPTCKTGTFMLELCQCDHTRQTICSGSPPASRHTTSCTSRLKLSKRITKTTTTSLLQRVYGR